MQKQSREARSRLCRGKGRPKKRGRSGGKGRPKGDPGGVEDRACPSCRRIRRARTATKTAVAANKDSIGLPAARGAVPVAKAARDPVPVPVARAPFPVARAPVPFARVGLPVPVARDPVPAAVPAPVARDAVPVPVARAPVPVARGAKFRQSKRQRSRESPSRKKSSSEFY